MKRGRRVGIGRDLLPLVRIVIRKELNPRFGYPFEQHPAARYVSILVRRGQRHRIGLKRSAWAALRSRLKPLLECRDRIAGKIGSIETGRLVFFSKLFKIHTVLLIRIVGVRHMP